MHRQTKIVATLGPATEDPQVLAALLRAGVDTVRVNFSHGIAADHRRHFEAIRRSAAEIGREVAILADIQGPKIRIACFAQGSIMLNVGHMLTIDADHDPDNGTEKVVGVDYPLLYRDVRSGHRLRLGDGEIVLEVVSIEGKKIYCRSLSTAVLYGQKGINLEGGGLSAGAITEKDKQDIQLASELGANFVALSFVRSTDDIKQGRALVEQAGGQAAIIAKIERAEAVQIIEDLVATADGVMIARGDLAIEIGEAEVPGVQKQIVKAATSLNKPVIVATQMMESMIHARVPTRAEVSDVANAVLDGTDAVMLSAETAVGKYPELVVKAMAEVCLSAEKHHHNNIPSIPEDSPFQNIEQAVAFAAMHIANGMTVRAIIALTESGKTALLMSRIRSGIPIFGLSRHADTRQKMMLYRDVVPIAFDVLASAYSDVNYNAVALLETQGYLTHGDMVILTKGDYMGGTQGANAVKILTVGNVKKGRKVEAS